MPADTLYKVVELEEFKQTTLVALDPPPPETPPPRPKRLTQKAFLRICLTIIGAVVMALLFVWIFQTFIADTRCYEWVELSGGSPKKVTHKRDNTIRCVRYQAAYGYNFTVPRDIRNSNFDYATFFAYWHNWTWIYATEAVSDFDSYYNYPDIRSAYDCSADLCNKIV